MDTRPNEYSGHDGAGERGVIRLVIVDDQRLVRSGLVMLCGSTPDLEVVGEGTNGVDAVRLAAELTPDLILMDIQLPEVSGLEVTKWIKEDDNLRSIPIIAVTAFAMKGDEERIRQGGCEAYISKPISVVSFLETIRKHLG